MDKGIGFPVCISVNEIVGHFSPLISESQDCILKEGDVAKIDLGVHVDGYLTMVAHTIVVQSEKKEVTGRQADVILAAYNAI